MYPLNLIAWLEFCSRIADVDSGTCLTSPMLHPPPGPNASPLTRDVMLCHRILSFVWCISQNIGIKYCTLTPILGPLVSAILFHFLYNITPKQLLGLSACPMTKFFRACCVTLKQNINCSHKITSLILIYCEKLTLMEYKISNLTIKLTIIKLTCTLKLLKNTQKRHRHLLE